MKKMGAMNIILIIVAVLLIAFTAIMLILFARYQCIPDTLCTCVYTVLGGECGVMGWIKTTKDKYRERDWTIEDRKDDIPPAPIQEMEEHHDG